jgi:flagellar biosynthesis protein FlhG
MPRSIRAQRALLDAFPGSPAARALRKLAAQSLLWPTEGAASGRIEFFLERLIAGVRPSLRVVK